MVEVLYRARKDRATLISFLKVAIFCFSFSLSGFAFVEEAEAQRAVRRIIDNATGGDCTLVGTWDAATKTCTLMADSSDLFSIESDYVTLDGNGHTLTGTNTGYDRFEKGAGNAVEVFYRTGVTVRNLTVTRYDYGVDLSYSTGCTVTGITAINNAWAGISLSYSSGNTLTGNTISNYNIDTGICIGYSSGSNEISGNEVSNTERGIFVHTTCNSNDISGNILRDHVNALTMFEADSNNVVTGNTFTGNQTAYLSRNASNGNEFTNNTVEGNNAGIILENVVNNMVAGNEIIDNTVQARATGGSGNAFSMPADAGGGNRWDDFDDELEGCVDAGGDGFCDSPYLFSGGQDDLPRVSPGSQNSGGDCNRPLLRLGTPESYWATYADYTQRKLSADLQIVNYGTTSAYNVNIVVTLNTNGVLTLTPMPVSLGAITAGGFRNFTMQYFVPEGVQLFRSTVYTSATVGCDTVYSYPDSSPLV